jgi:hypothetical protein
MNCELAELALMRDWNFRYRRGWGVHRPHLAAIAPMLPGSNAASRVCSRRLAGRGELLRDGIRRRTNSGPSNFCMVPDGEHGVARAIRLAAFDRHHRLRFPSLRLRLRQSDDTQTTCHRLKRPDNQRLRRMDRADASRAGFRAWRSSCSRMDIAPRSECAARTPGHSQSSGRA